MTATSNRQYAVSYSSAWWLNSFCGLLLQTDVYLEELTDIVPEADSTTQTDAFLDRPQTPQFVPSKTGVDTATQIEQGKQLSLG